MFAVEAKAEDNGRRLGSLLSQVDFDQTSTTFQQEIIKTSIVEPTGRGRLSDPQLAKLEQVNDLFVPNPRGVESDSARANLITSAASWKPMFSTTCELLQDAPNACDQARALREIFRRFTASDDTYNSQCQISCGRESDIAALKSVKFAASASGALETIFLNSMCHYRLTSPAGRPWLARQIEHRDCVCVQRSCMES